MVERHLYNREKLGERDKTREREGHATHMNEAFCHVSRTDPMGWLRLVGSLELYVSFAEYRLFYRSLVQKRRIILRSLVVVATP